MSVQERKESDPFEDVLKPPPNETPEQKHCRVQQEEEAKRVSQAIDESIRAEKQREKKRRPVRVLLLGQSESGASVSRVHTSRLPSSLTPARRQVDYAATCVPPRIAPSRPR
jgi:guanine nucleotide-binding protein alpha-1 subunit